MIKYQLGCAAGHEFEAWFASMETFDRQSRRGLVTCPECASNRIEKRPMAPAIVAAKRSTTPASAEPRRPAPAAAITAPDPATREMIVALRDIKAKLLENSEHVGARFAEEARRIHFGEAESRSIHGEATLEDATTLHEDGVVFAVLPQLPDEHN